LSFVAMVVAAAVTGCDFCMLDRESGTWTQV